MSHTPHYGDPTRPVGWGPTVRELDHLSTLFAETVHVAPLHKGEPPASARPYSRRVSLVPVTPAGGETLSSKLHAASRCAPYARTIRRELARADVVHIRCPANIAAVALAVLAGTRRPPPAWIKYAGSWVGRPGESIAYRAQRAVLTRWPRGRGVVSVNGEPRTRGARVVSMLNPCLTDQELTDARLGGQNKRLSDSVRLLWVGAVEEHKRPFDALDVLQKLIPSVDATLDVVGDGSQLALLRRKIGELDLGSRVTTHGWKAREEMSPFYSRAHFNLLTSATEGWPKVLGEGMAHAAVPLATSVGSVSYYLKKFGLGPTFRVGDTTAMAEAAMQLANDPSRWAGRAERCLKEAQSLTYSQYLSVVAGILAAVGADLVGGPL